MTPRECIRDAAAALTAAGVPDALFDASVLLSSVLSKPALMLRLDTDSILAPDSLTAFHTLLGRRLQREPLQYILGSVTFMGHDFHVDTRALIPRPETELLAEHAISLIRSAHCATVLDVCCGTGCIGLSIALACPNCKVLLSDLSESALSLAQENAQSLGAKVTFLQGDLLSPLDTRCVDLIVSNPPYIPTDDCPSLQAEVLREPLMALDGGADGLDFYRRLAVTAPSHLNPGGQLLVECGDREADSVTQLFLASGFTMTLTLADLQGIPRVVQAAMPTPCVS